MTDEKE